jgi:NhaP-type Na+/H+ or K+/H+ antiporter
MTGLVLTFGVALLLAVATSDLASRSPLSSTSVFLAVGLVAGPLGLDVIDVQGKVVEGTAVVALYTILFTDGQEAPWPVLRAHWRPAAAALLVGMPLTLGLIAALAHWVTGLPWIPSLVLGAVLAPTDPVFASALVGRHDVPRPVRNLLNIESGLNDGLALPAVLLLVGVAGGEPHGRSTDLATLLLQLVAGVALGVAVPLAAWLLHRAPHLGAVRSLRPLGHVAIGVILFGLCQLTSANAFLAAFAAGATIATLESDATDEFRRTGERLSELLQGAALLAFATLLGPGLFSTAGVLGFVLAVLVIVVSRPVPVLAVLAGTSLSVRQRVSVAWFGPKGFASVAYAAIVAFSGMDHAEEVVALTAVTVLLSAVAHSSTDLLIAEKLAEEERAAADEDARGHAA